MIKHYSHTCLITSAYISTFGGDKPLYKYMDAVMIHIRTTTRELVPLLALVIPTIAYLTFEDYHKLTLSQ